jgi:hypothetical protein
MKERLINGRFFFFWLIGCAIIVSRRPGILFDAQLWSEDGFIFFDEAVRYGWQSFITPYAGYIHLVPRTVTYLALQLSEAFGQGIVLVPFIMNLCTVALSSICAVIICSSKFRWMGSIYFRILLSFFILVFPNAYEVWGNATNVNWWLGILEFFLLWHILQNRKMPAWSDIIILSIIVLSSPNGLLVLPAILWAYFRVNKIKPTLDLLKVFLILALALIQLHFLLQARVPKESAGTLFFYNTVNYVLEQLFGNLLVGQTMSGFIPLIIGSLLLLVMLFFSRGLFKKLYIPFAFLFSIVFITVFGADLQAYKYGRYIFVPTVVIVTILLYEGREQWKKRGNLFSMMKIALFALLFLLISVRIVRNYQIDPCISYPWKTQAALFDPQGKVFYNFPINPIFWSVAIPSSHDREEYIPESLTKISVDNSHIVRMKDLERKDSLFRITGPVPEITYQLPETAAISYCSLDFGYPLDITTGQICFLPAEIETSMIFHVEEKILITANENMLGTKTKWVRFNFFKTALNDSFVIKQLVFYALPSE